MGCIRAGVLAACGHRDAALAEYRHVLEVDPGDPAALNAVLEDCRARSAVAEAMAVANRALELDPGDFIALVGLTWGYLQREDHQQANAVVERALKALDTLDTRAAFRGLPRVMLSTLRLVLRLPGLRGRFRAIPSMTEAEVETARGIADWRRWALSYMAWYREKYGSSATTGANQ